MSAERPSEAPIRGDPAKVGLGIIVDDSRVFHRGAFRHSSVNRAHKLSRTLYVADSALRAAAAACRFALLAAGGM